MKTWALKAANTTQLAALYGIDRRAMANLITHHQPSIGNRIGYFWRVDQVLLIFHFLGPPPLVRVI